MKRILTLVAVFLIVTLTADAQSKRYVLFEHFTQASCGPCAAQNPSFEAVVSQNEGKYHHIAYHTSWPGYDPMHDLNPTEVQARVNYYNVTGVPDMNMLGSVWNGGPAGVTTAQIDAAAAVGAPIRVGVSDIDLGDSHEATVTIEETGVLTGTNLKLRIVVLEHYIDYGTAPGSNGETAFPNVFREMPSTTAGITYTPSGEGTSQEFTVSYDVNAEWNEDDLYVIAWLQDDADKFVVNSGSSVDPDWEVATSTSTLAGGVDPSAFNANIFTANADDMVSVSYTTDQPSDWSATITVGGVEQSADAVDVTLAQGNNEVGLIITPGSTAAIANYTLTVTSLTYPDDPIATITYTVVAGITDLIVDHGGVATQWNEDYSNGLALAGNTSYGVLPINKFIDGMNDGQLDEVLNVYDNISWTFPGFTEAETAVLATFMANGGNVFVNGQDVAWDTFQNEGTAVTQAFFTEYMSASYVADGSGTNNQLTWNGDVVFDGIANSSIINVYGGANIYPDEILPIAPAVSIYNYNGNANKTGAIRVAENGHKVVYVGVDLGMISNESVRNQLIQVSHDWFYGIITDLEYDMVIKNVLGQNYPNPALANTVIPFDVLEKDAYLSVIDLQGRLVQSVRVAKGNSQVILDVSSLNAGMYQYYMTTETGRSEAKSFEVIK